jgi:hypothetical protein
MSNFRRVLRAWIALGALATALCLLVYVVAQQIWRHAANDPQIQMARDGAAALSGGQSVDAVVPHALVDMQQSLSPFVIVFDPGGRVVAASGRLHGKVPTPPSGVLDQAREHGEQRVTWQPEPGVRIASVVVPYAGGGNGSVLAGRSMEESEARTRQFQGLIGMAWLATLGGLLVVVAASEWLLPPSHGS